MKHQKPSRPNQTRVIAAPARLTPLALFLIASMASVPVVIILTFLDLVLF